MNLGRGRNRALIAVASLAALVGVVAAGCGEDAVGKDVKEGETLGLGALEINVQLTRFLNPDDPEDSQYLAGQQLPPPKGMSYLGVFMQIKNTGDEDARLPTQSEISVVDTTGVAYPPVPSDTDYALDLGGIVPPHEQVPATDTAAASGPVQGSIVIFLVDESAAENRPLDLEIAYMGEDGTIELDI
jgi:hypothetical protein